MEAQPKRHSEDVVDRHKVETRWEVYASEAIISHWGTHLSPNAWAETFLTDSSTHFRALSRATVFEVLFPQLQSRFISSQKMFS